MILEKNGVIGNRYSLTKKVGRGAFGEVWLARDRQVGIDIAIKIYIALDDKGIKDFKEEYSKTYRLNHQNLLHASYFDVDGDRPFLVMPYCPGSALELIGTVDETADEAEVWKFIRDTASGLEYLHGKNIIHRDIKPDNILKDEDGNYVITDFGISLKLKSSLRRNSIRANGEGDFSGTVAYMGPEMFSKIPVAVKETDVWALGATLYEILTGELPFFGQGGVMLNHGAEIPQIPGKWSKSLSDLLTACLQKETWQRPSSSKIKEIAEGVLKGKPQNAPPRSDRIADRIVTVNRVTFKMVTVDGGSFRMGSSGNNLAVTLKTFQIGETLVTQELWQAVMGTNPSHFQRYGLFFPVECVSWGDCQLFISKLNFLTGLQFRLPTEAEWEFAARGGNKSKGYRYSGSDNPDSVAWHYGNSDNSTHAVKNKLPNELGIYDMSGNIWEWCSDLDCSCHTESSDTVYRVKRGGCFLYGTNSCDPSTRNYSSQSGRSKSLGLRLSLSL